MVEAPTADECERWCREIAELAADELGGRATLFRGLSDARRRPACAGSSATWVTVPAGSSSSRGWSAWSTAATTPPGSPCSTGSGGLAEAVRAVGNLAALRAAAGSNGGSIVDDRRRAHPLGDPRPRHEANAHPHSSTDGSVLVVMNGIIENYIDLRSELQNQGVVFSSETDSEVVPQLIASHYARRPGGGGARGAPAPRRPLRLRGRARRRARAPRGGAPGVSAGDRGRRGGDASSRRRSPPSCARPATSVLIEDDEVVVRRGRRLHDLERRRRGAAPAPIAPRRLERGRRREGRLRDVHAQGDPRAARRPLGHDRRPPEAGRLGRARSASGWTTPPWPGSSASTSSPAAPPTTPASWAGT